MNEHVSLDLENTNLWKAFAKKADDKQRVMVKDVCNHAASLLDLIRDTFPTYTLHNRIHAINVIGLMGRLLNDHLQDLSALEGAILILSAYCHDVGMVFTDEERKHLDSDPEFKRFLREYPEASVILENSQDVSEDVAEWYCRWIHPDRVFKFLKSRGDTLRWGIMPITEKLGYVCRSHGYDSGELIDNDKFPTDYLEDTDLKFCALILRLADILDFDNSRSPEEVYKYLGIERNSSIREENSDTEWKKHLVSQGFSFTHNKDNITLKLNASPNDPTVEYDVRKFLDIIETELHKCRGVLKQCSDKWKNFPLPLSINRNGISSNGYRYGEYRFVLDQQKVPELLMGENLYNDPFVFVRELIQNAIDTSRHRLFYEKNQGVTNFSPKPIEVYSWLDDQGFQWVRIDDFGMGMTEEIIKNYFLKVGESYYQSNSFRASTMAARKHGSQDFVPISRFGIGILSCFIVCDRIEVSTRHFESNSNAIRLSLPGLHSFYILQSEEDKHYDAKDMPSPNNHNNLPYREKDNFGTSIAVRLDPRKERGGFDLDKLLDKYISCSTVPIICNNKLVGSEYESITAKPWIDSVLDFRLTKQEKKKLEKVFQIKLSDVRIKLIPLNLTKYSPSPYLGGQALIGKLVFSEIDERKIIARRDLATEISSILESDSMSDGSRFFKLEFNFDTDKPYLQAEFGFPYDEIQEAERQTNNTINDIRSGEILFSKNPYSTVEKELENNIEALNIIKLCKQFEQHECKVDLARIIDDSKIKAGDISQYEIKSELYKKQDQATKWISHNGIRLPQIKGINLNSKKRDNNEQYSVPIKDTWVKIFVALQDGLRPEISLSRDEVRFLTWDICSNLSYSFISSMQEYNEKDLSRLDLSISSETIDKDLTLGKILRDKLLQENLWSQQKIIFSQNERVNLSLEEIKKRIPEEKIVIIDLPESNTFNGLCSRAIIQTGLDIQVQIAGERQGKDNLNRYYRLVVLSNQNPEINEGQKLFAPLLFAPYEKIPDLIVFNYGKPLPLNQNHPFSSWLIKNSPIIKDKYPAIFSEIREKLHAVTSSFFGFYGSNKQIEIILSINVVLSRLQKLDPNLVSEHVFIEEKAVTPSRF